jgi:hypothetical protein
MCFPIWVTFARTHRLLPVVAAVVIVLAFWLHDSAEPALADGHGARSTSTSTVIAPSAVNGALPLSITGAPEQGTPVHAVLLCAALLLAVGLTVAAGRREPRGLRVAPAWHQRRERGLGRALTAPPPHALGLLRI